MGEISFFNAFHECSHFGADLEQLNIISFQYSIMPKHRTHLRQITEKTDAKLPKIGIID